MIMAGPVFLGIPRLSSIYMTVAVVIKRINHRQAFVHHDFRKCVCPIEF